MYRCGFVVATNHGIDSEKLRVSVWIVSSGKERQPQSDYSLKCRTLTVCPMQQQADPRVSF